MIFVKRLNEPGIGEKFYTEKQRLQEYIEHATEVLNLDSISKHFISRFHCKPIKELEEKWYWRLSEQFHNKCAYCETVTDIDNGLVKNFRPVEGIKGEHNTSYDFHYIWLCYDWNNLYWTCANCAESKRNYFPVQTSRTKFNCSIRNEKPLLIDPCNDRPENHIHITEDGIMIPKTNRGKFTIDILNLNQTSLVKKREHAVDIVTTTLEGLEDELEENLEKDLEYTLTLIKELFHPTQPYLATKKSCLANWIKKEINANTRRKLLTNKQSKEMLKILYGNFSTQKEFMDLITPFIEQPSDKDIINLNTNYIGRQLIEYIEIHNIRGLSFKHKFNTKGKESPWLMLLGENGTGKTTVLQAITLALSNNWTEIKVKAKSFVPAKEKAIIEVKLINYDSPIKVLFHHGDIEYYYDGPKIPIISYGATRLIPKSPSKKQKVNNISNLFISKPSDYFLEHPKKLLKDENYSNSVASVILDVLPFDKDEMVELIINRNNVYLQRGNNKVALEQLSSGYQNVIAITADIMRAIYETDSKGHLAEGIVLIDEIDSHLHPTWKMRIVTSLRKAFPYMQFIVTSHDPLCLRGIKDGEVVVMKNNMGELHTLTNLPDPNGLRIDQILTSDLFGLDSTIDLKTDKLIKNYYKLLNKKYKTTEDEILLRELEKKLEDPTVKYLGYTNRERLLYKTIDHYIAKQKEKNQPYHTLDKDTQSELLRLWGISEGDYE